MSAIDDIGGAATRALHAHLTPPFAAGAARTVLPLSPGGRVAVGFDARRPVLLVSLRRALGGSTLVVTATPDGGAAQPAARFAPWSDAGSELPLYRPARGVGVERLGPFALTVGLTLDGAAVAAGDVAGWVDVVLLEGNLGTLLAVLGSETARLRRQMRELAAMRGLAAARDDALDRVGADLGIPRLDSVLGWDAATKEIVGQVRPEDDAAYRTRLGLYRPFLAPGPAAARAQVAAVIPGAGITEPGEPLAIAVRLLTVGDAAPRVALLARLRADWLLLPGNDAAAEAIHAARYLPASRRAADAALRGRLRAAFAFPAGAAIAPRLADALDRAGRILSALGGAPVVTVARAQDADAGSRYELGLGVDVVPPAAADAQTLRARLMGARNPGADPEAEALIRAAKAAAPADDGTLEWLWRAAGLRTAQRLANGQVYLSHLRTAGLTIDGPASVAVGAMAGLRAVFNAPGDPGQNAALAAALVAARAGQAAAGAPAFAVLDAAAAPARWDAGIVVAAGSQTANVLVGAGLPVPGPSVATAASLKALPQELLASLALPLPLSAQIRAGDPASIPPLAALVELLRRSGIVSLLPVVTPAEVVLVAGVIALPTAGVNLGERRATGVRWSMAPLGGRAGIGPVGSRSLVTGQVPGLVAVVAIGYVRDGLPDPYEIRATLPDGALLDLPRYELLMNALERCFPVGVEVNTWDIRQRHVDLNGDGVADPLPPSLARHYRRFRMPRLRGLEEPTQPDPTV